MSININKVGEQIKKFRELRNYTQEGMAKELDMTPQGYGKIERNEVEITLHKLQKVADILGTTIQDILGFQDRFVFNNQECQQQNVGYNQNANLDTIQKMYEARLEAQQKEIDRLHEHLKQSLTK
jgi:transcriptional regulator with XRE-family HTH domain